MEKKDKLFIIGIDPGKNGGIVSITNGKITDITKMPPTPEELVNHFLYLGFPNQPLGVKSYVIMEAVHSMPTDGSKSAFSFGKQVGQIEGVLASLSIKPNYVPPQTWQKYFGLRRGEGQSKHEYKKMVYYAAHEILESPRRDLKYDIPDKSKKSIRRVESADGVRNGIKNDIGESRVSRYPGELLSRKIFTLETCDAYLIALWFWKNHKKIIKGEVK